MFSKSSRFAVVGGDPPKSPLEKGDFEIILPPFLRGAGGDLRGRKTRARQFFALRRPIIENSDLAAIDISWI